MRKEEGGKEEGGRAETEQRWGGNVLCGKRGRVAAMNVNNVNA